MRRSLTAVLALSLCSASALAADTLRIDIKGLDGDLAANARAWVEPLEKAGYTDTPAARMNVDKAGSALPARTRLLPARGLHDGQGQA